MRRPSGGTLLLGSVVAVVAIVLGIAVAVLDSPAEVRRQRLDKRRSDDLHTIAVAIDEHWRREGELPADLNSLADQRGAEFPPIDPITQTPYRYRITGAKTYELCAEFATATSEDNERSFAHRRHAPLWRHPAGEHCVELHVDTTEG